MPEITRKEMQAWLEAARWNWQCLQLHFGHHKEADRDMLNAILAALGKPNGVPLSEIMFNIQEESPLECSFEEDARYHWPKRWEKLGGMNLMVVKGVVDERS